MAKIISGMIAGAVLSLAAHAEMQSRPVPIEAAAQNNAIQSIIRTLPCGKLVNLQLAHTTIVSAQIVPAGSFTPVIGGPSFANLPEFCRVVGVSKPTASSNIGFEVWLPMGKAYNRRFEQVGNGGFAGVLAYDALAKGIRRGFASASTDDGHQGFQDPAFARNAPEKIVDFGWRAVKETTDRAKSLIQAFYGAPSAYSFFVGCSDGGREALMTAQRYPNDFDGIIAGAPANHWTHQFAGLVWDVQAAFDHTSLAPLISPAALSVLSTGVRAQCAGKDGGLPSDKYLNDPRMCVIDWSKIQCAPGQNPATCLSAAQVTAVKAIYAGPSNAGGPIYPGYEPGAEDATGAWQSWITGPSGMPWPFTNFGIGTYFAEGFFADFVYGVTFKDLMTLNFTSDLAQADTLATTLNSADPDLSVFRAHGGKLIQYVGWADPAVAPRDSIVYYEQVRGAMGLTYAGEQSFYRLYMAPGMCHCAGGPGANVFGNSTLVDPPTLDADHDMLLALQHWREDGVAPQAIVATKFVADNPVGGVDFQRPLCPYPAVSHYKGAPNDPNNPASYACRSRLRFGPPLPLK